MTETTTLDSAPSTNKLVRLWLYLLAGPVIYAGYFVIGYLWVEIVCHAEPATRAFWLQPVLGMPLLMAGQLGLSLLAAVATAVTTWLAWMNRRRSQSQSENSAYFLASGGLLLGLLFLLLIIGTAVLLATLAPCRWI